jgi:hypothetical protein
LTLSIDRGGIYDAQKKGVNQSVWKAGVINHTPTKAEHLVCVGAAFMTPEGECESKRIESGRDKSRPYEGGAFVLRRGGIYDAQKKGVNQSV